MDINNFFWTFAYCNHYSCSLLPSDIRGEHKVFPRLQTFITRKLCGKHIFFFFFLPLRKLVSRIFQQDGAPPHWGSRVHRFLDATFPNRWTGRDGPTPWPSPPFTSFYGGMLRTMFFDTSSRYYKFEDKNNRRFCYNN